MTGEMPSSRWLRGALWDSTCLAFCWVPFYLWIVFGLGLGGQPFGLDVPPPAAGKHSLAIAVFVVLCITWIHRHYTFLLVYGDRETFRRRRREYSVAPIVLLIVVVGARWGRGHAWLTVGGLTITPWMMLLVISGAWNVWHTIQQRYGILRAYAAKSGGGLQRPEHGRRDRLLLWISVVVVSSILLVFRMDTFAGHPSARRVMQAFESVSRGNVLWPLTAVAVVLGGWIAASWWHHEMSAPLKWRERLPRLSFLASTFVLLLVFVVHGPVVGYLCFGAAHALEYIAFVHHFGQAKFAARADHGVAARLLSQPLVAAPLVVTGLGLAYFALEGYRGTDVYLAYYFTTSMLHFLYDGWIWKVRRPDVARPLGVQV